MKFVFWQSILSIHQSSFLNALSKGHEVILVVERESDAVRKQSGWKNPTLGCKQVIIAPNENIISGLISDTADSIHVISGLEMTFPNYQLTKKLTDKKYKIICYLEPFNWLGIKGFARRVKYTLLRIKYGKKLSAMLPTGRLGADQYRRVGFNNVFEWGYFTEAGNDTKIYTNTNQNPTLLFVGSLDQRKNILTLIETLSKIEDDNIKLSIIGDGPLRDEVVDLSSNSPNISYLGVLPNDEVKEIMGQYDILVLPSIFDGWGAVVNEALSAGMRVICSDRCGASTLLDDEWRGSIFSLDNTKDLSNKLETQLKLGVQTPESRERIINWCNTHITGEIAAKYFTDVCEYLFSGLSEKPIAPWKH